MSMDSFGCYFPVLRVDHCFVLHLLLEFGGNNQSFFLFGPVAMEVWSHFARYFGILDFNTIGISSMLFL